MAKKFNSSQFNSKLRQLESKQRQSINKLNNSIRQYNTAVRQHNSKVLQNRRKIQSELQKLQTSNYSRASVTYTATVRNLNTSYISVASDYDNLDHSQPFVEQFYAHAEQENANSLQVSNALFSDEPYVFDLDESENQLSNQLSMISDDLNNRWKGAVFALNPYNPDATRHFCTSAREIFTEIFKQRAPDDIVIAQQPNCDLTPNGTPSYRAKIKYFLSNKNFNNENAIDFADKDIKNVVELIRELSGGTHGQSGKFTFDQLKAIKIRVESSLSFLCNIVN